MLQSPPTSPPMSYANLNSGKGIVGRDFLNVHQRSKKQTEIPFPLVEKDTIYAEFYGYAIYLITIFAFVIYITWAYLPNEYLDAMGWTYYPNKDWAVTIPAFLFMSLFFVISYHIGYVLYHTPSLDSFNIVTDECAIVMDDSDVTKSLYDTIPPFEDIPVRSISTE